MNLANAAASSGLTSITALLNNGTLTFYSGTQPATPETALSGNTALAAWTFSASAFGSSSFSGGFEQQTASFVAATVTPSANGTVTFARLVTSGAAVVMDLTVGTSGTDIIIGNTTIATTINVSLSSFVLKIPAS